MDRGGRRRRAAPDSEAGGAGGGGRRAAVGAGGRRGLRPLRGVRRRPAPARLVGRPRLPVPLHAGRVACGPALGGGRRVDGARREGRLPLRGRAPVPAVPAAADAGRRRRHAPDGLRRVRPVRRVVQRRPRRAHPEEEAGRRVQGDRHAQRRIRCPWYSPSRLRRRRRRLYLTAHRSHPLCCPVTYTGRRPDGTVFADAHDAVLTIGKDDLLEGLELAIKSMCRGEHSLFHVDPSYAYGRAGCPDLGIAADAALDYDVHLLSFEAGTLKWEMSTEAKVDLAECRKAHGNAAYKAGQIERAERLYDQCLELVNYEGEQAAASRIVAIRIATWNNLAAIKTKREAYAEAIALAGKVLALDPGNGKARYRRALCYMRTTQPDLALDDVDEALRSDPTSASLLALQAIARKHLAQAARKQAKQFGGWCDRLSLDTTTTNSSSSSSAAPRQDAPGSAPSPTK